MGYGPSSYTSTSSGRQPAAAIELGGWRDFYFSSTVKLARVQRFVSVARRDLAQVHTPAFLALYIYIYYIYIMWNHSVIVYVQNPSRKYTSQKYILFEYCLEALAGVWEGSRWARRQDPKEWRQTNNMLKSFIRSWTNFYHFFPSIFKSTVI